MRQGRPIALVCLMALLATACGSATSSSKPAAATGGSAGKASTSSAASGAKSGGAAASSSSASSSKPIHITFAQSSTILSYAPAYIARAKGYLKKDGIDATFDVVKGDGPIYAGLSSGSVQFGMGDAAGSLTFGSKGLGTEAVYAMDYETIDVAASAKWVKAHHVSRSTPIKQRVLALRGATWGYTSAGSISETLGRYLVDWAGMNANSTKDATFAAIGGLAARQAALKSGQIQVYLSSPPGPQQAQAQGFGYVLIPSNQLPGFSHVYNEVLVTRKAWAAKNPQVVREVVAAFVKSTQLLQQHPTQAQSLLKEFFSKYSNTVLKQSVQSVSGALVSGGKMNAADWKLSAQLLIKIGSLKKSVDTSQGKYWTNQYLGS